MSTPVVILVAPQLAENIGATARAMLNCGLTDLRLVRPRPAWPDPRAVATAVGADRVLDGARLYGEVAAAIADLNHVYATTARAREIVKPVLTARAAAADLRRRTGEGERCGLLFGPERTGLENDDVSLADTLVTVPLNPDFDSLNLAQAVLLLGYEWYQAADSTPDHQLPTGRGQVAAKGEVIAFFERLEAELEDCGFLRNQEMRPHMIQNIRAMFHRAGLMEHEVRTLHGVLTGLVERPHALHPRGAGPRSGSRHPPPRPSPSRGEGGERPTPPRPSSPSPLEGESGGGGL